MYVEVSYKLRLYFIIIKLSRKWSFRSDDLQVINSFSEVLNNEKSIPCHFDMLWDAITLLYAFIILFIKSLSIL